MVTKNNEGSVKRRKLSSVFETSVREGHEDGVILFIPSFLHGCYWINRHKFTIRQLQNNGTASSKMDTCGLSINNAFLLVQVKSDNNSHILINVRFASIIHKNDAQRIIPINKILNDNTIDSVASGFRDHQKGCVGVVVDNVDNVSVVNSLSVKEGIAV